MSSLPKPLEPSAVVAMARLTKKTFHSLVYQSALGQSLYFSKEAFGGEEPSEICITLEWDPKPDTK